MAIGVYVTYRMLDYADLTVDGSIATGGAVCVMLILGGVNPWFALVAAFAAGAIAGLVTGLLHAVFGIPPILSGILSQLALYSVNMRILGKSNQAVSVDKYSLILSSRENMHAVLICAVAIAVLIGILYWFFGTEMGSAIRATGSNPNMSRSQGINTNRMKILGLSISNGLVGLSGGLLAQYSGAADVKMGQGAIVIGLAAVIIGQVIFGKLFRNTAIKFLSVVFGAILYYIVISIVVRLGLSPTDLKMFSAILVALFLALPSIKESIKSAKMMRQGKNA
ncbi:MAG: ABC transporter permease [Ruminococcaceae bacterium]|nr:ABC transporter permease [Oscillospiraceae bacterium]